MYIYIHICIQYVCIVCLSIYYIYILWNSMYINANIPCPWYAYLCIYIYTYVTVTLDNVPNKSAGSLHQLGAKNHTWKSVFGSLGDSPRHPQSSHCFHDSSTMYKYLEHTNNVFTRMMVCCLSKIIVDCIPKLITEVC